MTTDDAKTKALKLLALAVGSTYEEERRTAALVACRLIHEHGLLNDTPAEHQESPGEAYERHQQAEHKMWREHWEQYGTPPHPTSGPKPGSAEARADSWYKSWYKETEVQYEARRRAREAQEQSMHEARPDPPCEPERYRIRSKFVSICRNCGQTIRIEDICWWRQGAGVWCASCYLETPSEDDADDPAAF